MKSSDYNKYRNALIEMKVENFQNSDKAKIKAVLPILEREAIHKNDWNFLLSIYKLQMSFCFSNNDLDKTLYYSYKAIDVLKQHPDKIKELVFYSIIIQCYQQLGDYATAQTYVNNAIELSLEINHPDRIAAAYYNAALQYEFLNNKTGQKNALLKCIEYGKKATHKRVLGFAYANISVIYKTEENYNRSLNYLELAEVIAQAISNQHLLAFVFTQKAILLSIQNKNKNALLMIDEAIKLLKRINERTQFIETSIEKIKILIASKNDNAALKLLKSLLIKVRTDNSKSLQLQLYSLQHQLLARQKNTKEAYAVLLKYTILNQELFNEASDRRIKNLEITHHTNQIKREKEHAEKLAKLKHDFLANMSHEIRTPINNIMGLSFLLQDERDKIKQHDYLSRIHKSSEILLALINDVLDISKIEAGKFEMHFVDFSLEKLVNDIRTVVQQKADEKKLKFRLNNKLQHKLFVGDPLRLQQVLLNILYNAIKFTNKGSITLTLLQSKVNEVQFIVEDTGIGIEKNKLKHIFSEYEQASSSIKTNYGGTGLGLSISKKLVSLMNGAIFVESIVNKGTKFTISIPLKESTLLKNETIKKQVILKNDFSVLNNISIFYADDYSENRKILEAILLKFNSTIQLIIFENGKQLLDGLSHAKRLPALVITDIDMPVMNGFELVKSIRKQSKLKHLKVIATTSSLLLNEKEEVLKLGFDALLQNPVPPDELIQTIIRLLDK